MTQAFDLSGKVAVVSGATRGIGQGIAIGLAEAGADIVLLQRSDDTSTEEKIKALGVCCKIIQCDLMNLNEVKQAIPKAIETMGSVDILVNNAGIQRRSPAVDFSEQDWDDVLNVNLKAVWILCQQAGRHMVEKTVGKLLISLLLLRFKVVCLFQPMLLLKGQWVNLQRLLQMSGHHKV
ncbi:2-dehydro-3-deoxy-D-gluconate 5-dehydrogenase [Streptomyces afghaniensis]